MLNTWRFYQNIQAVHNVVLVYLHGSFEVDVKQTDFTFSDVWIYLLNIGSVEIVVYFLVLQKLVVFDLTLECVLVDKMIIFGISLAWSSIPCRRRHRKVEQVFSADNQLGIVDTPKALIYDELCESGFASSRRSNQDNWLFDYWTYLS